jgi:acyl-coenzyme A synthetase/AMP-(fatty) acid ligase
LLTFTLLAGHAPGALVAFGDDGPRTAVALAHDAEAIAVTLPPAAGGKEVLVACADRYAFLAGLIGAWSRGHSVVLPPSLQPAVIDALSRDASVCAFLHDNDGRTGVDVRRFLATRPHTGPAPRPLVVAADRPLVTLFTSGSTGAPLRWMKTAAQLLGEASLHARDLCANANRFVATVPSIHIYGLLFAVLVPLMRGAAFLRETPFHARAVAAAIARFDADVLVSVPAHLRALESLGEEGLPHLRVLSSGAPLHQATADILQSRWGLGVTEIFGSTETGGIATRERPSRPWRPLAGVHVTSGSEGQMLLDSPFLASDAPRPFACADRVAIESEFAFRHLGRGDRVVKVAARRVDLDEMERHLRALPGVVEAAVVAAATEGARGSEIFAAVVAPTWSSPALRRALLLHFDPGVVPRRVARVPVLPRESTGKLRHEALRTVVRDGLETGEPLRCLDPIPRADTPGVFDARVPRDLEYFRGHFEGEPILAGVVQLDILVLRQVAAMWPELTNLRRVTRLRFVRPIRPGDDLELSLTRPAPARVHFEIRCSGASCSAGTLHFRAPVES